MGRKLALAATTAALGGALASAAPAQALDCSAFRTEVENAVSGETIELDAGSTCAASYQLPNRDLTLTLRGLGSGATLDGSEQSDRILGGNFTSGHRLDLTVENLTFRDGTAAAGDGGAIALTGDVGLTLVRDRFSGNSAPALGGAVFVGGSAPGPRSVTVSGTSFGANFAGDGGSALALAGSSNGIDATVASSTLAGNSTGPGGDGSAVRGGALDSLDLRNSIAAGNAGGGADVAGFGGGVAGRESDACALGPLPGPGNLCADPALADAAHGDTHETIFSPTVDHGAVADVPAGLTTDLDGDARSVGPAVDIGADELTLPAVVSGRARPIASYTATLDGTIDPDTHPTSYHFEYGETTGYGHTTPDRSLPAADALSRVTEDIATLTPATTYHFRLVATNSAGTAAGLDQTFRTDTDPFHGVGIVTRSATVHGGSASISVSCTRRVPGPCAGDLALGGFGHRHFSVRAGGRVAVKVRLSKSGRRALAKKGSLTVTARAVATDGAGTPPRSRSAKVKLKGKRRGKRHTKKH